MGQKTEIQWSDSTINPSTGCDGCELWGAGTRACYAGNLHEGRLAKSLPMLYAPDFTEVRLVPGRMAATAGWPDLRGKPRPGKPWLDGMPRIIFVGDMGDLLSKAVPFEFIDAEVVRTAASPKGSRHLYLILTKQAARLAAFSDWLARRGGLWPANLWAGVSVTGPKTLRRINALDSVNAPVKFVSFEPLRGAVDISGHADRRAFDWAIIGGESNQRESRGRPFDLRWARDLIGGCNAAGIAAFMKQVGSDPFIGYPETPMGGKPMQRLNYRDSHGGDWSEWPEDLRVREFPEVSHA